MNKCLFIILTAFLCFFSKVNTTFAGAPCMTVNSITCSSCNAAGDINNTAAPVLTKFCVNFTNAESGVNWIHGVYVNGAPAGFNMATMTGGGGITGSDGAGTWLYMNPPSFTSTNSGNLITDPGYYYERSGVAGNPGDNLGDAGTATPSTFTFCYDITTESCATLGNVDTPGSISFGFTTDSYSGSWSDVTCGQETPAFSYNYTIRCCWIVPTAGPDQSICPGQSATLTASAPGATTYSWAPGGATTASISVTPAVTTTYTVTVGNGTCSSTDQVVVNVGTLTVDAGANQTICPETASTALAGTYSGETTGTTNTTLTNSTSAPIPDQGNVNSTIASAVTGATVSSVCVNITHNWNDDVEISLSCPGGTNVSLSTDNGGSGDNYTAACFDRVSATNISTIGGVFTSPITGNWLPENPLSGFDACASNGTWTLNVADDAMFISGTLDSWSITLSVPNPVVVAWTPAANLSSTTSLTPTFTNPGPGTYTYTLSVTDAVCTVTDVVTITVTGPVPTSVITNASCGVNNGAVNLSVTGGTTPYTYVWSSGPTTQDISGLAANTYTVTVTDAKSCTATHSAVVVQPAGPTLSTVLTHVQCFGATTGAINLSMAGGTSPFTYLWSNASTVEDPTGLAAGAYTVTVTDFNSCTATISSTLTSNPDLVLTNTTTNVLCPCESTGAVDLTVAGGVPGYSYLWSSGATTQDISSLAAATYTVTVTDSKSCTKTASYAVTQPTPITVTLNTQTNVNCFGECNGAVNVSASGGTAPYDYSNTGGAAYQFNNQAVPVVYGSLCAGAITITVRDGNNCVTPP